uniref:Enolase n=1 Tax=Timema cristinae TaxID=61476 RepID=A0A7R9DBL6_TIMCR|nr:unnamed protein product [Timema cristinae]
MPLQKIFARQIFDSRGNPTVEVDLVTDLGLFRAAVPSGASTGIYEALELRDNKKEHYHGKGVQTAIDNINNIITPELLKQTFEATQQEEIDDFLLKLDGTENKSKFGANAILGVSLAVCKAGAAKKGVPLYNLLVATVLLISSLLVATVLLYRASWSLRCSYIEHLGHYSAPISSLLVATVLLYRASWSLRCSYIEPLGHYGAPISSLLVATVHLYRASWSLRCSYIEPLGRYGAPISSLLVTTVLLYRASWSLRHIADLAKNPNIILPVPAFNVINGGSHAGNKLAMQEFMIFPSGAKSFTEAMKMGSEVYHHLMKVIKAKFGLDATSVGDEGGFAPNILNNKDALNLIVDAIEKAGYSGKIEIGMDVAASEFYRDGKYDLDFKNPNSDKSAFLSPQQLQELYLEFIKEFPMVSIEDPFDQDDWAAWSSITASTKIQIKTGAPCRSERLAKYNQILRIEEELGAKARYAGKNFRNPV